MKRGVIIVLVIVALAAGVVAVKLYPAGATTNSDFGVTDIRKTYRTLEAMQRAGILLLVHGEVTDPAVDIFDREAVFLQTQLAPLRAFHPAEAYHQDYATLHPESPYIATFDRPKIANLKSTMPEVYREEPVLVARRGNS